MNDHVDSTGWATFGTTVGVLTAAHELSQFATAMFTLVIGIIVAHFLKRFLNEHFPPKKRQGDDSEYKD